MSTPLEYYYTLDAMITSFNKLGLTNVGYMLMCYNLLHTCFAYPISSSIPNYLTTRATHYIYMGKWEATTPIFMFPYLGYGEL
jgi:hypothetical protein